MFNLPIGYKEPYEHIRLLLIPSAINDYNRYIGRVDTTN